MEVALLITGIVAFIAGIVWLAKHLEKKRTEAMHAWAQSNGYSLDADWNGFHASLQQFKLFNQGHTRKLRNLMRASRG